MEAIHQNLFCCATEFLYYLECNRGMKSGDSKQSYDYSFTCNEASGFEDFVLKKKILK